VTDRSAPISVESVDQGGDDERIELRAGADGELLES